MIWRIYKYMAHLFYRRHRKGHGIHSPYVFDLIHDVVFHAKKEEIPALVLREHLALKKDLDTPAGDGRSVGSFARHSSVSEKQGALLFRLVRWFHPEMILELGTGLGISALYMAMASPGTPLHSIEGNTGRAALAAQLVSRCSLGPVSVHWGEMEDKLRDILPLLPGRFLAFVDGNHHYEPTLGYLRNLVDEAGEEAIIVLDDIYWSRDMYRAWQEIISWPEIPVSIDLFHLGILVLRKDLHPMNLKIKF